MYFRMLFEDDLAHSSYMIGCPAAREAVVIDPLRDVDRYLALAERAGMAIRYVCETHIHADYLSGTRELARAAHAVAIVSGEGGPSWTPRWLEPGDRAARDGEEFSVGGVSFRVMHTPGHTPEHVSYMVSTGAGAMGVCTGDFVFVGGVGRPDLLERAAGHSGSMEPAARDLCASLRRFTELPEHLQVWPGHGAGSACGKSMLAVPQSTVGYELRGNPSIALSRDESAFVKDILSNQPDAPAYFARMKRLNVEGPALLRTLPRPEAVEPGRLLSDSKGATIVDTRSWEQFRHGHLAGSLHAPLDKMFTTIVGSYVEPEGDVYLVCEGAQVDEAVRRLVRVGIDRVVGHVPAEALRGLGGLATMEEISAREFQLTKPTGVLLDVRREDEFAAGHVAGAAHVPHVQLRARLSEVPPGEPLYVMCLGGVRSARACALLASTGRRVINIAGGYGAWQRAGGVGVR